MTLQRKLSTDWAETWHWRIAPPATGSIHYFEWTIWEVAEPLTTTRSLWYDRDKMKSMSFSPPFSLRSPSKNLEAITAPRISLRWDMKWAHIINISILFDCPPNKSHCSNKQRTLLRRLPLSGFELSTLHLAIYYRHLSQVTDKHCDGCMIWLCQSDFISSLQATIWSRLMSCANSLYLTFSLSVLSFPLFHLSDGNCCEFYPLKNPSKKQMSSII